jgi:hypothetical protein
VQRLEEIAEQGLCGFVLKKDSPTCGLERVRVYNASGVPTRDWRGLFAAALVERFPTLPVEEEGRSCVQDPGRVSALMPTLFLRFEAHFVVFKTEQPARARSVYVTCVFVRPELEKTSHDRRPAPYCR